MKTAHLAAWFFAVIQDAATSDAPTAPAENKHRQLRGIMTSCQHAGAEEEHGVVQRSAFPFLDALKLARNVGNLRHEKLVYLQPVGSVRMGQQVVNHVIDTQIRKA